MSSLKHSVLPPRVDVNGLRVQRPRENVGDTLNDKDLLRIAEESGVVVDNTLFDLPTSLSMTAWISGGGHGAPLPSQCFERAERIGPGAEGACGCAVACRVGKVGRPLGS